MIALPGVYAIQRMAKHLEGTMRGQAYALGQQTVCRLTLKQDAVIREILRTNTERQPRREYTAEGVVYQIAVGESQVHLGPIPTTDAIESLYSTWPTNRRVLPITPRGDAAAAIAS